MKRNDFSYSKHAIIKGKAFLEDINYEFKNNLNGLIEKSEMTYKNQVEELVSDFASDKYNKIMLIAGPSSSGKTTSSVLIKERFNELGIETIKISLDDFFLNITDRPMLPNGSYDFESIYSIDLSYFGKFIDTILTTGKAKMPIFDFLTGRRKKNFVDVEMKENAILIIEGLHALNPALLRGHNAEVYKVYICLNTDFYYKNKIVLPAKSLRLMRRCLRDYYSRETSVPATLAMWENVLNGEEVYIKPYKMWADYLIDSTHLYEPLLYAKYLMPLLNGTENNKTAESFKEVLKLCKTVSRTRVPEDSLLWEFLTH